MMFGQKRKTFSDFRVDLEGSGSPCVAEPLAAWPFMGFSTSWLAACAAACRRVRTPGESAIWCEDALLRWEVSVGEMLSR